MNYTRQMATYYEAWPSVIPSTNPSSKSPDGSRGGSLLAFGASKVQEKIPALPFLVPAVIEKLQSTPKYGAITIVQPGEADLFCARYVKENGGIVVTGDSDLLVHDLGTAGSVAFLKDLNVAENLNRKTLRCHVYEIATIVERLALKPSHGIRPLAFEMVMDAHASFPNLVQRAKGCKAMTEHAGLYADFAAEYLALPQDWRVVNGLPPTDLQAKLRSLDPRISEFALQFPVLAAQADAPIGRPERIFLPFLIDCPSKTSAWEASTATRQLAYGLLNLTTPPQSSLRVSSIIEHRRQQSKESRGREWALPNAEQIEEACQNLWELHNKITEKLGVTGDATWRAVAFYQDLELAASTEKASLGAAVTAAGNHNKRLNWAAIHFSAQLQGSYYSLRMLKQVLGLVTALHSYPTTSELPAPIIRLHAKLGCLGSLESLNTFYEDLAAFSGPEDRWIMQKLSRWLESPSDAAEKEEAVRLKKEAAERKKEKRNKRNKLKRKDCTPEDATVPVKERQKTNMFELLGDS